LLFLIHRVETSTAITGLVFLSNRIRAAVGEKKRRGGAASPPFQPGQARKEAATAATIEISNVQRIPPSCFRCMVARARREGKASQGRNNPDIFGAHAVTGG
jgi:hypothetical protein